MFRSRAIYASLFFACSIGILPAIASDGATPIWEPTIISQPGTYVVTRNLAGDGPVIHVAASDVEIDLNGFTLTAIADNPVILGVAVSGVRIQDGTVSQGNTGIYFELSNGITIDNVSVLDSSGVGIDLVSTCNYVLRQCTVFAAAEAIRATASYGCPGLIEGNRITGAGLGAPINETVLVQGGSGSTVRDNTLTQVIYGIGIHLVDCDYCEVSGNLIDDFGADALSTGITVESSTNVSVTGNASSEPIVLIGSTACTVSHNRVGSFWIDADSDSNLVLRNSVESFSGSSGIYVEGDRNRIEGNVLNDKPGFGLYFTSTAQDNIYAGNLARGNFGSGGCTGTGTTDFCDEGSGNTSNGDNSMPAKM